MHTYIVNINIETSVFSACLFQQKPTDCYVSASLCKQSCQQLRPLMPVMRKYHTTETQQLRLAETCYEICMIDSPVQMGCSAASYGKTNTELHAAESYGIRPAVHLFSLRPRGPQDKPEYHITHPVCGGDIQRTISKLRYNMGSSVKATCHAAPSHSGAHKGLI